MAKRSAQRDSDEPFFLVRSDHSPALWVPAPAGKRSADYILSRPSGGAGIDLLPDAQPALAAGGAWIVLTSPTTRYPHGILGDPVEAGAIAMLSPQESPTAAHGSGRVIVNLAPQVAEEWRGQTHRAAMLVGTAAGSLHVWW